MSKTVLFVIGSFRKRSFHHQLAQVAEEALVEQGARVRYLDYQEVPHFSQDSEIPVLPAVQAVRDEIQAADAIWLFSPVYNHSMPGILKNLLDWVSRALDLSNPKGHSAIHQKVTTVSSVAHDGHEPLFEECTKVLNFIRTKPVGEFTGAFVNDEAWETDDLVISDDTVAQLKAQAAAVLAAID